VLEKVGVSGCGSSETLSQMARDANPKKLVEQVQIMGEIKSVEREIHRCEWKNRYGNNINNRNFNRVEKKVFDGVPRNRVEKQVFDGVPRNGLGIPIFLLHNGASHERSFGAPTILTLFFLFPLRFLFFYRDVS